MELEMGLRGLKYECASWASANGMEISALGRFGQGEEGKIKRLYAEITEKKGRSSAAPLQGLRLLVGGFGGWCRRRCRLGLGWTRGGCFAFDVVGVPGEVALEAVFEV